MRQARGGAVMTSTMNAKGARLLEYVSSCRKSNATARVRRALLMVGLVLKGPTLVGDSAL
jgi:hypothetical protein